MTFTDLIEIARKTGVPKEELDRVVRQLVEAYDPLRVYLFGSFAWGVPRWNSDLDFCCVVENEEEAEDRSKGLDVFYSFERRNTDFYLLSKPEFEKMLSNPANMEHKIYYDADTLYAKPDVVFDESQPFFREEEDTLKKGGDNLIASRRMLIDPPIAEVALFHVQQCIEQSCRAFWAFHLQPIMKNHELNVWRKRCGKIEPAIMKIEGFHTKRDAERLSNYYWLRYRKKVIIPPDIAGVEAEIAIARRVYEFVKHYIETTEPPAELTAVPEDDAEATRHPRAGGDPDERLR